MGGGKGGKPQTTTTQSTSQMQLPSWLEQGAQQAVGMGEDLSQRPYTPYTGEMVAPTSADQLQAYQQVRALQGSTAPAFQQASAAWNPLLSNLQSQTAANYLDPTNQLYSNYMQQVGGTSAGLLGGYLQGGPMTAQQVGSNAMQLMSPYEQAVINPAMQAGQQMLAQDLQKTAANANNVGAFGGSRQGVMEGVAQAQAALGASGQIGQMLATGYNQALGTGYNIANAGSTQGFNAATALANMAQQGYNPALTAGQALANTNLGLGQTAASQIPQLATAGLADAQKETSMLQTVGAAQQAQQQAVDNSAMGQYYAQQDWPVQNLDILLGAVSGVPYGTSTAGYSTTQGPAQRSNPAAGIMGGAATGASLGAAIPGIGAPIGAVGGAIMGLLGGL